MDQFSCYVWLVLLLFSLNIFDWSPIDVKGDRNYIYFSSSLLSQYDGGQTKPGGIVISYSGLVIIVPWSQNQVLTWCQQLMRVLLEALLLLLQDLLNDFILSFTLQWTMTSKYSIWDIICLPQHPFPFSKPDCSLILGIGINYLTMFCWIFDLMLSLITFLEKVRSYQEPNFDCRWGRAGLNNGINDYFAEH